MGPSGPRVAAFSAACISRSSFWSLIPFTMQMCMVIIGGYVTADSPPVARLTEALARS